MVFNSPPACPLTCLNGQRTGAGEVGVQLFRGCNGFNASRADEQDGESRGMVGITDPEPSGQRVILDGDLAGW